MTRPIRVLIADDSVHARAGLCALLATWPDICVVGEAANGEKAIQLVEECLPDVVLMDVHMPILDGIEATRLIKQRWPLVLVVVLTVYSSEQPSALKAGADAFLIKGGAPERLLTMLGVAVAGTNKTWAKAEG